MLLSLVTQQKHDVYPLYSPYHLPNVKVYSSYVIHPGTSKLTGFVCFWPPMKSTELRAEIGHATHSHPKIFWLWNVDSAAEPLSINGQAIPPVPRY
jgi:hypothetical protein